MTGREKENEAMGRLTERTADGILVKEDQGESALKTLYQCYGTEPMPHYANCDEGYCVMEKLAKLEDMADVREKMCDEYCQYPSKCPNQETLDNICKKCELAKLFEVLEGKERI